MKKEIVEFVSRCLVCQQTKAEHQRPAGLLWQLEIPVWKWDEVTMDLVTGLPKAPIKQDAIWVIVDQPRKSAHFIPIKVSYTTERLAEVYMQEIVRLHEIPSSVVSDQDTRSTSRIWEGFQKALGTQVKFSSRKPSIHR